MRKKKKMNNPVSASLKNNLLDGAYAVKATCEQPGVIDPFQYYAKKGESIYSIRLPRQSGLLKFFAHFNEQGDLVARFLEAEADKKDISQLNEINFDYFDALSGNFAELMSEMHLSAAAYPADLFETVDMDQIQSLFPKPPIVIGGCGRSGTTLLLSMLGVLPAVLAIEDEQYPFYPYPFRLRRLAKVLSDGKRRGQQRWCEKTPKNVRAFGPILKAFGKEVRIVHLVRDGRDVVTSHHPNHEERYWVSPERWVADVRSGLNFGEQILLLRYEDLVAEPENSIKKLCAFINEEFDARMVAPQTYSSVKHNVAWEGTKIRALDAKGIGRWKAPEHTDRVREFKEYPGTMQLMKTLGYS
jgi:sulfotransferase family protein